MAVASDLKLKTMAFVIFYVKDVEKALGFYRDKLGMTVKVNRPGWAELDTGEVTLALHVSEKIPGRAVEGNSILVFPVENVYETYQALVTNGVKFEKPPEQVCEEGDQVGIAADFCDPDGNKLSIYSMMPK